MTEKWIDRKIREKKMGEKKMGGRPAKRDFEH
jgi:hypothetical protein